MQRAKMLFLTAATGMGLVSCRSEMTRIYTLDEQGHSVDSFVTYQNRSLMKENCEDPLSFNTIMDTTGQAHRVDCRYMKLVPLTL